jgi:hypothetical protein
VITRVARVDAAGGETRGPEARLRLAAVQAGKVGLVPAGLEARLALGSIQVATAAERAAGLQLLEAVRREADQQGFRLIKQRAETAMKAGALAPRLG